MTDASRDRDEIVEVAAEAMYQSLIDNKRGFSATGLCVSTGRIDLVEFARVALDAVKAKGYAIEKHGAPSDG